MGIPRLASYIAVAALLATGCSASLPRLAAVSPSQSPLPEARPTEPIDARLRTACASRVLGALVDAINAHDEVALARTIASGPSSSQAFQWVSMSTSREAGPTLRGPGVNEVDYTPEGARRILLRHAAAGERWTLSCLGSAIYVLSLGDE